MERQFDIKSMRQAERPVESELIGWSDNYLPHFERLPAEVQRSLISHFERLATNRSVSMRERTAAQRRAESLKRRFVQANEEVA